MASIFDSLKTDNWIDGDGKMKPGGAFWGKSKFATRMANAIMKKMNYFG